MNRRCAACGKPDSVPPGNVSGVCDNCDLDTGPGLGDLDDELYEAEAFRLHEEYLDRLAEREMEEDAIRSAEERD